MENTTKAVAVMSTETQPQIPPPKVKRPPLYKSLHKSLFFQLFVAVVAGILVGAIWPDFGSNLRPFGDGFIKLIKMVIAPLIFCVVVNGISHVGSAATVGRVGMKALIYFEVVTTFALFFCILVANVLRPGTGFGVDAASLATGQAAIDAKTKGATLPHGAEFVLNIIPDSVVNAFAQNQLLSVLFFAVMFGIALSQLPRSKVGIVIDFIEQFTEALFKLIGYIMKVAPIGAFGAMAFIIGQYGLASLGSFAKLIAACYIAGLLFVGILMLIAKFYVGMNLWHFIKFCKSEFLLALGTASTEAVLPRIMTKLVQSGNSQSVTGLVVPTGYSFNLDGATLYLAIASMFLAQAFGHSLSIVQQLTMIGVLMLTSKGMAGVPGSSFLALSATAAALGVYPVAGVAILLGADRIMDSMRVFINLLGNCLATFVVAKSENALDRDRMKRAFDGHPDDFDDIIEAESAAAEATEVARLAALTPAVP